MNDKKALDQETGDMVNTSQEETAAEAEKETEDGLAKTVVPVAESLEQMYRAYGEMNRRITAWVSENQEAIARAARFAANVADIERAAQEALAKTIAPVVEPLVEMYSVFENMNQRVAAWVSENQEAIARAERFIATAGEVALRIAELMTEASQRFREVLKRSDHVAKLGWTFASNLHFVDLVHLSKVTNSADADAYVSEWYEENDPRLEAMEQRLRQNPRLLLFRTVLPQCFSAIRRSEFAVTIPCLIAILEAVMAQFNPPDLLASTNVKKALRKGGPVAKVAEQDILAAAMWLSLVTFIEAHYKQYPAVGSPPTPFLSRPAILHGREEPPNEKIEAIRLLHTLETALSLHEEIGSRLPDRVHEDIETPEPNRKESWEA
jgi:post-segregation antitoxin (ccd killing protein)